MHLAGMRLERTTVEISVDVKNKGEVYSGKEVVQIYVSCPDGELKKEAQRLTSFAKTKNLKPGEEERTVLQFDLRDLTSYREKDAALFWNRANMSCESVIPAGIQEYVEC